MKHLVQLCLLAIFLATIFLCNAVSVQNDLKSQKDAISQRVVNGEKALPGQFPYIIGMIVYRGIVYRFAIHRCDGSIINSNWILTAAHCIVHSETYLDTISYDIYAGSVIFDEFTQFDRIYEEDAFAHPEYNETTLFFDIALLKSHGFDLINDPNVKPINLAPSDWIESDFKGKSFILAGFGFASDNHRRPYHLLWAVLPYASRKVCASFYYEDVLPDNLICAGDVEIPVHSSCDGDSGGPLIFETSPGELIQVGVVSFGSSAYCSKNPAGFTFVPAYRDWIDSVMAEHPN